MSRDGKGFLSALRDVFVGGKPEKKKLNSVHLHSFATDVSPNRIPPDRYESVWRPLAPATPPYNGAAVVAREITTTRQQLEWMVYAMQNTPHGTPSEMELFRRRLDEVHKLKDRLTWLEEKKRVLEEASDQAVPNYGGSVRSVGR